MGAKKRKKSTKLVATLRPVINRKSLNGYGALEPISCAYFSTVFRASVRREAWGNSVSHWLNKPKATLDPNDILVDPYEIEIGRGASCLVEGKTFLVARGRDHSLLISIDFPGYWNPDSLVLNPTPGFKTLTIGSLYTKIIEDVMHDKREKNIKRGDVECEMFVTKSFPTPIARSDDRRWSLVRNSGSNRGWEVSSSGDTSLDVEYPMLLLHAFINCEQHKWATGSGTDLLEELAFQTDISEINLEDQIMKNANLSSADLSGADLSCADLSRADFSSADLSHADLSSADLSHADLPDGVARFK